MTESWYAALMRSVPSARDPGAAGRYFLKPGYTSRARPDYFEDDTEDIVYQPDVYPVAAETARKVGASLLVDIGCGRGEKLVASAGELDTIGIDVGTNLTQCRDRYPERRWVECDLDRPHVLPMRPGDLARAVLICSDVVEHLVEPEHLLASLRRALEHARLLVLSTPERDLLRGIRDTGPPANTCHVREWNLAEFTELLEHHGLAPLRVGLTRSDDRWEAAHTMLALVAGRRASRM
jgi:SAM-dependent methyltransferase